MADTLAFQTEKQLKEYGDKIPAEKRSVIESALADLKAAHQSQDFDRIDKATEALNNAWQAASQEMYQATQESGANPGNDGANGQSGAGKATDDVTDVEYEEVKS